jgi:hypothetical protein
MQSTSTTAPSKRAYQAPKLQVYGSLTEMTQKGPSTQSDSGMNHMS